VRRLHLLAGPCKRENVLSDGLRKVHEGKLASGKEVVLSAFIDNPDEIVLGCARVWKHSVDLARMREASFLWFLRHRANGLVVTRFMIRRLGTL
jgi:hypothetical protein